MLVMAQSGNDHGDDNEDQSFDNDQMTPRHTTSSVVVEHSPSFINGGTTSSRCHDIYIYISIYRLFDLYMEW